MDSLTEKKQLKRAQTFLKNLGLSYDTLSPATQKYLLDLGGNHMTPDMISGSIVSQKFNSTINSAVAQNGGGTSFPSEYFTNVPTSHYSTNVSYTTTSSSPDLARVGLQQSGGLLKYSDYSNLKTAYEKKFLRQLKLNKTQQKNVIDKLNVDINTAFNKSLKENKNKLTKNNLQKHLK